MGELAKSMNKYNYCISPKLMYTETKIAVSYPRRRVVGALDFGCESELNAMGSPFSLSTRIVGVGFFVGFAFQ